MNLDAIALHALAEATPRVPEQDQHLVATEVGEVHLFAGEIRQLILM